jgi:hypothetical protein
MQGAMDSRQLDGPECETVFVNPTMPDRLETLPTTLCLGADHSEEFEQALSFTLQVTDGFKSSVWLGTVADRKSEARAGCDATICQELFFV